MNTQASSGQGSGPVLGKSKMSVLTQTHTRTRAHTHTGSHDMCSPSRRHQSAPILSRVCLLGHRRAAAHTGGT